MSEVDGKVAEEVKENGEKGAKRAAPADGLEKNESFKKHKGEENGAEELDEEEELLDEQFEDEDELVEGEGELCEEEEDEGEGEEGEEGGEEEEEEEEA